MLPLQDKSSGKRIMGMTPQNSIATMVASKPHALWDVPDNWTLAQSATVPVAYATAYDALVVRGRLQPHHRVLIHSATGAVGLAATRIALNRGCEVRPRPLRLASTHASRAAPKLAGVAAQEHVPMHVLDILAYLRSSACVSARVSIAI